jgi:hypothetical protein
MLSAMKRYSGVRGKRRVKAIVEAIGLAGGRVLNDPDPSVAPFEISVSLPNHNRLDLVCYAFTAKKYGQKKRPADEHRFQVKYKSNFKESHPIYIDEARSRITLFFGFHEEMNLFVAVDPAMHNPTWFSSSIEFKEEDLEIASASGWHGWERERVAGGRRRAHPLESLCTEVVHAFRPEHFLTYARLEAVATGLDPGERLLLIDRIGERLHDGGDVISELFGTSIVGSVPVDLLDHPLLKQFQLPVNDFLNLISTNFRLLVAVRGSVAEYHLHRLLERTSGVSQIQKLDQDGQPDFNIQFRGRPIRIECKNVLRKLDSRGPRVDFQKTRASKSDPCSRYYSASQFEVLAACIHPVEEKWDFRYRLTKHLAPHRACPARLSDRVLVDSSWSHDLAEVLAASE